MQRFILLLICIANVASAASWPEVMSAGGTVDSNRTEDPLDTNGWQWRQLAVWCHDRIQPFDSAARATWGRVSGTNLGVDPDRGHSIDAVDAYLEMVLKWQGWDHPQLQQLADLPDWPSVYFRIHQPDRWDRAELFPVDTSALRLLLRLRADEAKTSAARLAQTKVVDAVEGRELSFDVWIRKLRERRDIGVELTEAEVAGLKLAERLDDYMLARMGRSVGLIPVTTDGEVRWVTMGELLVSGYHDVNDPSRRLREAQQALREWRTACLSHDPDATRAAERLLNTIQDAWTDTRGGAELRRVVVEAWTNRCSWLTVAWGCLATAGLVGISSMRRNRPQPVVAGVLYAAGTAVAIVGVGLRGWFAGRLPWWGDYELLSLTGTAIAVAGAWGAWRHGCSVAAAWTGLLAAALLCAADGFARGMAYEIVPISVELYGNLWLTIHVMLGVLSLAALGTACSASLAVMASRRASEDAQRVVMRLCYLAERSMQAAVVWLSWALAMRCCWAASGWGRDWTWNVAEVLLLAVWLSLAGVVAARSSGRLGDAGILRAAAGMFVLSAMAGWGLLHTPGVFVPRSIGSAGGGAVSWSLVLVGIQLLWSAWLTRRCLFSSRCMPALLASDLVEPDGQGLLHREAA